MNIDTLLNPQFLSALIIGASIGSVSGYIGSLMITKRMALMGGALGHLALPGVALGLTFHFDISIGALLFLVIGITTIWAIEKITKLPFEAITAVVFTTFLSISFLFLPHKETHIALLGDLSLISMKVAIICVVLSLTIFVITHMTYKKMVLLGISEDLARVEGIDSSYYHFAYLLCIALVVALGVRIIGGLMTAALVAIPAASSKNISASLRKYAFLSALFGGLSCVLGIISSYITGLAVGPMIIIVSSFFFLFSILIRKK